MMKAWWRLDVEKIKPLVSTWKAWYKDAAGAAAAASAAASGFTTTSVVVASEAAAEAAAAAPAAASLYQAFQVDTEGLSCSKSSLLRAKGLIQRLD